MVTYFAARDVDILRAGSRVLRESGQLGEAGSGRTDTHEIRVTFRHFYGRNGEGQVEEQQERDNIIAGDPRSCTSILPKLTCTRHNTLTGLFSIQLFVEQPLFRTSPPAMSFHNSCHTALPSHSHQSPAQLHVTQLSFSPIPCSVSCKK
jgi:hypothetical protein